MATRNLTDPGPIVAEAKPTMAQVDPEWWGMRARIRPKLRLDRHQLTLGRFQLGGIHLNNLAESAQW